MLFFCRKEVYLGDLEGFNRCKAILSNNKIKYDYTVSSSSSSKMMMPQATVAGIRPSTDHALYYLYVHKKDYENAKFLLHS